MFGMKKFVVDSYQGFRNFAGNQVEKARPLARKAKKYAAAVAVAGSVLIGGYSNSAHAEDAVITMPSLGVDWAASATGIVTWLSGNLAPILGVSLGVVGLFVMFSWLKRGVSGR